MRIGSRQAIHNAIDRFYFVFAASLLVVDREPLGPSIIWRCLGPLQNNSPVMAAESSRGLFRKEGREQKPTLVIRILVDLDRNRCMICA